MSTRTYADTVAMQVKLLRVRQRLSQHQLAERVAVSQFYIGKIERGDGNLTLDVLCKLATTFGVPPARLLQPLEPLNTEVA